MAASTNVQIEDNFISTHNLQSHGIYMGNASANRAAAQAAFSRTW